MSNQIKIKKISQDAAPTIKEYGVIKNATKKGLKFQMHLMALNKSLSLGRRHFSFSSKNGYYNIFFNKN